MYPIFISDDPDAEETIASLPGQKRWGINKLEGFLGPLVQKGLKSVILFGVPMKMQKVWGEVWESGANNTGRARHHCGHRRHTCHSGFEEAHSAIPKALLGL